MTTEFFASPEEAKEAAKVRHQSIMTYNLAHDLLVSMVQGRSFRTLQSMGELPANLEPLLVERAFTMAKSLVERFDIDPETTTIAAVAVASPTQEDVN
jgi:hypothetical protein